MRTASWETSAGALAALLNSRVPLNKADLYTITLAGGTVLRWSGHHVALVAHGNSFALGPGITRSRLRWAVGIEVDSMSVTLTTDAVRPNAISGTPLLQYVRQGGFSGARVQLERAYWGTSSIGPVGTLIVFQGRLADVKVTRVEAQMQVKSDLELLNVMVPRDVYQSGCLNTLYDASCGLNRTTFQATSSATSATDTSRTTFSHAMAQAAGYFDLGVVKFTSGANNGVARTVKRHTSGQLVTLQPLPAAVANGDTFQVWPGCDKLQGTCSGKFANLARFRGQPYIPMAETVT